MITENITMPKSSEEDQNGNQSNHGQQPVIFTEQITQSGHTLGIITLADTRTLNSLSTDMCKLISKQLASWKSNHNLVAVLLKGEGNKAFCAGGNIRNLYDGMIQHPPRSCLPNPVAEDFFASEYKTHRAMHSFNKPIIVWATGIVMGGGMGLLNAASHRIVTETTRFAMPEINIGLFPDACGSWFLQRMPAKSGLFIGLTGANCNASDALFANMAEYAMESNELETLQAALLSASWKINNDDIETNKTKDFSSKKNSSYHNQVSKILAGLHDTSKLTKSNLLKHWQFIQEASNKGSIYDVDRLLRDDTLLNDYSELDAWLKAAVDTYRKGCPATAAIAFEAFHRAKGLSVEEVFYMELTIALNCADYPDFREGVRALLIDKDRAPKWSKNLAECDEEFINSHFISPYKEKHPFDFWKTK